MNAISGIIFGKKGKSGEKHMRKTDKKAPLASTKEAHFYFKFDLFNNHSILVERAHVMD